LLQGSAHLTLEFLADGLSEKKLQLSGISMLLILLSRGGCYSVFDRDDHGINDDDDDFDYEELLHHIKPRVLNFVGTDRVHDNMEILEKSSREPL
jgi:hypothetical protein